MNDENPIFSHQIEAVRDLSTKFEKIQVITHEINLRSLANLNSKVLVENSSWEKGKRISNSVRFLRRLIGILKKQTFDCAFFHMTEVSACLALPLLKIKKIPVVLWYAHKSNSIWLRIFHRFGDAIVTSTDGSCPIKSEKVFVIGQSINDELFKYSARRRKKINFIYVGRVDPSKRVIEIVKTLAKFKPFKKNLKLEIFGTVGNKDYGAEVHRLVNYYNRIHGSKWISFNSPIPRFALPKILKKSDCMVHNFRGSLDKVLLEAGCCGLPVVTTNNEFNIEFETNAGDDFFKNLQDFFDMEILKITKQTISIHKKIVRKHSLKHWTRNISDILKLVSNHEAIK